ncbi:MAG: hypothetical protein IPM51_15950 [Sphingobacteriaceae bacterium]|nr:hypothetical protein [Sphingobacteriaceae bacterium]
MNQKIGYLISFNLLFIALNLCGQDTHYWTNQFGPRSALLGGAVVGGVRDNSAVYYNPGALALIDTNALSVSATGYQYDILNIKGGAGEGYDLKSNQTRIIPLIMTGIFKLKKLPRHSFGYAILTKDQTGMKMSARNDSEMKILPDSNCAGNQDYIGQFNLKSALNEQWFGGAWAYKLNEHISAGITLFGALRDQSLEYSFISRVSPDDTSFYSLFVSPVISFSDVQSINYTHMRGFAKMGLAFDYKKFKFGFGITTPGFKIFSSGSIIRDVQYNNLNLDNQNLTSYTVGAVNYANLVVKADSFRTNLHSYVINDRQTTDENNLQVNYKSPTSISAGFEYIFKRSSLSFSMEWFAEIWDYSLIEPEDREVMRPKKSKFGVSSFDLMHVYGGTLGVTNFAFAYQYHINSKLTAMSSFRTNWSSSIGENNTRKTGDVGMIVNQTDWDLYHITLGAKYKKKKSDVSIGIGYAWSNAVSPQEQLVNLKEPSEEFNLAGDTYDRHAFVDYKSISLILGYTYYFK